MPEPALLFSCEHAVNDVPARFANLFSSHDALLASHRGFDAGALELGRELAAPYDAPCYAGGVTRLLVDLNRSPHNRSLWSAFSRELPEVDRRWLLEEFYRPFRAEVAARLAGLLGAGGEVLHLSVHSFTPVLDGRVRKTDIGLLYDPRRAGEKRCALRLQRALQAALPELVVHMNAPYRGTSDCHQAGYRRLYTDGRYLAMELEVNQRLVADPVAWPRVRAAFAAALRAAL